MNEFIKTSEIAEKSDSSLTGVLCILSRGLIKAKYEILTQFSFLNFMWG